MHSFVSHGGVICKIVTMKSRIKWERVWVEHAEVIYDLQNEKCALSTNEEANTQCAVLINISIEFISGAQCQPEYLTLAHTERKPSSTLNGIIIAFHSIPDKMNNFLQH